MKTSDFDYHLPPDHIAQHPAPRRDASRLLWLDRASGAVSHHGFGDLPQLLRSGDLLVVNDTRVIPARLFGVVRREGGAGGPGGVAGGEHGGSAGGADREVEVLLLREEPAVPPE